MPELAEPAGIALILEHDPGDCPFCKSNEEEKPDPVPGSSAEDDELEDDDGYLIGNDSGKLEKEMEGQSDDPRPADWKISAPEPDGDVDPDHQVKPNPHHLIPGNESLKQTTGLLEWIFESKGKISGDIGYDVNNHKNGVWLPSNNGMRGNAQWSKAPVKQDYVIRAMNASGGHFHDRHGDPYSKFVTKILNKIADRMNGRDAQDDGCPYKTEKGDDGKYKPPYALVARLNGVSQRLKPYLKASDRRSYYLYTSKLVPLYYWSVDPSTWPPNKPLSKKRKR